MRKLLLAAMLLAAPSLAQADVIAEYGVPLRGGQSVDNGYIIVYSFAPLVIPGQITNVEVVFTGLVNARIGGAQGVNAATGNTLTSVTLTPMVSFANSVLSGPTIPINPASASFVGMATTQTYDNVNNVSVSSAEQAVTLSSNASFPFPANTFTSILPAAINFFAGPPFSFTEPKGSTANFPGGSNYDRSSGNGSLLLAVTYNNVPEPASLALLGVGLLGKFALRRRRSVSGYT